MISEAVYLQVQGSLFRKEMPRSLVGRRLAAVTIAISTIIMNRVNTSTGIRNTVHSVQFLFRIAAWSVILQFS